MKLRQTKFKALALVLALAAPALLIAPVGADGGPGEGSRTYRVVIENLTTGQPLTPAVAVASDDGYRLFRRGHAASPGLQQLAENGGVPVLAAEVAGSPGVSAVEVIGSAPIAPGGSVEQLVTLPEGAQRLSFAAMLVCSNDGFAGISRLRLPEQPGQSKTVYAKALDAGTEINTEAYADIVPPCDGMGGSGMSDPALAENGVVRHHAGITGAGDLDPAIHGWDGAVMKVTVERVRVYEISVTNLTSGQPLTPFVFATHKESDSVISQGQAASAGLQQLAENGGVPVLVAELSGRSELGTIAVVGAAPIGPGGSFTSTIVVNDHFLRASLAGMLVCSNDGFAGLDGIELPNGVGESTTFSAMAYDAGTEINTEAYGDLVPPCDGTGGSGMSDPALAENGVVHHHAGIAGTGDLDSVVHGIDGAVASVTITQVG